ncbi:MAG: serine/threonine protein kinase [Hydrogenophaga sp.]|nr:serine/threonine protein kinase [Hydrogenophaga sp.]
MKQYNIAAFPESIRTTLKALEAENDFTGYSVKGASGFVIFGKNKILQREIALKIYYWENGDHAEPEILANLPHANILQIFHAAPIDDDFAYFSTKYCNGGDLDEHIGSETIGLHEAVDVVMNIAAGASFLHANGYVHRDLKPQNIFLDGSVYVIGDFGSVAPVDAAGVCQTLTQHSLIYRTPEVVSSKKHYKSGDIYQMGIVLYQALGGQLPYDEVAWLNKKQHKEYAALPFPDNQIYAAGVIETRILAGKILDLDSLPAYVPKNMRAIVRKATHVDQSKRYESVAEFLAALHKAKASLAKWYRWDGYLLVRPTKTIRIRMQDNEIVIEKDVGNGWKRQHTSVAHSIGDAVLIAESM